MPRKYLTGSLASRLAARSLPQENGCVLFDGSCNNKGYGWLRYSGQLKLAHRVAWEVGRGAIPAGFCVCHTCDVPRCINVDHLFLGTHLANMRDRESKGRGRPGGVKPVSVTEINEFRRLRALGVTYKEIGSRTGRNMQTVWKLLHGKT